MYIKHNHKLWGDFRLILNLCCGEGFFFCFLYLSLLLVSLKVFVLNKSSPFILSIIIVLFNLCFCFCFNGHLNSCKVYCLGSFVLWKLIKELRVWSRELLFIGKRIELRILYFFYCMVD